MEFPFESTCLWRLTLGPESAFHSRPGAVERLRISFLQFRERAAWLAAEISAVMPDFTVHDVSHLDVLWRRADLICGPDFDLNPSEAFVLGGAFLIHDLGMAPAAYPGAISEIQETRAWSDAVASILTTKLGQNPAPAEIAAAPAEVRWEATSRVLRSLHAERAESLVERAWPDRSGQGQQHLIEDADLRARLWDQQSAELPTAIGGRRRMSATDSTSRLARQPDCRTSGPWIC
jgi:hypothetical protein